MDKKQIAIVGAGTKGLLACKYCLSKGFNPTVFEFEPDMGGVWAKTIKNTRLQLPKTTYQFSDFPWPASVTDNFPTQQEKIDYIRFYATHFNLIPHIKSFPIQGNRLRWTIIGWMVGLERNRRSISTRRKWKVTGEHTQTATTQVYTVDFVILCVERSKDVPNMPQFPPGKGPEVFRGRAMDHDKAEEFVKGKKVVVVGFGKTGLDIEIQCSSINGPKHPCTSVQARSLEATRMECMGNPFGGFDVLSNHDALHS